MYDPYIQYRKPVFSVVKTANHNIKNNTKNVHLNKKDINDVSINSNIAGFPPGEFYIKHGDLYLQATDYLHPDNKYRLVTLKEFNKNDVNTCIWSTKGINTSKPKDRTGLYNKKYKMCWHCSSDPLNLYPQTLQVCDSNKTKLLFRYEDSKIKTEKIGTYCITYKGTSEINNLGYFPCNNNENKKFTIVQI